MNKRGHLLGLGFWSSEQRGAAISSAGFLAFLAFLARTCIGDLVEGWCFKIRPPTADVD